VHVSTNDYDDAEDRRSRKPSFIGQANKIFNFRNVDSVTKTKFIKAYCTIVFMVLKYGTCRTCYRIRRPMRCVA
jgi:hypothetical protein